MSHTAPATRGAPSLNDYPLMQLDHFLGSTVARYAFLFFGGVAIANLMMIVPALRIALVLISVPVFLFILLVGVRYWGLLTDQPWAENYQMHDVDSGLFQAIAIVTPIIVGGLTAWLI